MSKKGYAEVVIHFGNREYKVNFGPVKPELHVRGDYGQWVRCITRENRYRRVIRKAKQMIVISQVMES